MMFLAALIFTLHLCWYVWVIFGALWTRNRPLVTVLHVLSLIWGIVAQIGPWACPLTLLEQLVQSKIDGHAYAGTFAVHYIEILVNPRVSYSITVLGALVVCGVNLAIYFVRLVKALRGLRGRSRSFAISLATIAVVTAGGLLLRQTMVHGQPSLGYLLPFVRAAVTGSDGSHTGTANFQGNFTSVSATGLAVGLSRQADCSLTLLNGDYSIGTFSFTQAVVATNYERVLHAAAGLTTTPDVFAAGCDSSNTGLGTRPVVFAGKTTSGVSVFAAVSYDPATGNNAVYTMNLNTSAITVMDLPTAGAIITADLNGDGNGDLIVVNNFLTTVGSVSIMLGNADGTFQTAVSYATAGAGAVSAAVDDVNGDGKLDLVVASDDQQISVLTGKGDGTFNSAQSFAAPLPGSASPASTPIKNLITADVNGDGKKDIVCSNGLVLLGNGDGTFAALSTPAFPFVVSTTNAGTSISSGDLNNDGKVDLVVAAGTNITTWTGKGDGTFSSGRSYASIANSGSVAVSDLDGDGNLDIYSGVANGSYFGGDDISPAISYALLGKGDGTFVGAQSVSGGYTGANIGDVNGDGYPDLISPATGTANGQTAVFTVQIGSASGAFTPVSTITVPLSVTFTVSEFTSPVTENTSNLTPVSYAVGDLNGDGKADVAYVSNYRGYAVYFVALSNGDGTFAPATATGFPQIAPSSGFDISTTVDSLRVGDFNHDGSADLIVNFNNSAGPSPTGVYSQGLIVLPGNGAGVFGAPILTNTYSNVAAPPNGGIPSIASIVDFNGDGLPDLLAFNGTFAVVNGVGVTTSTVQVYLGKADGTFVAPSTAITTTNLAKLTVADFNKDGKLDFAALTETSAGQAQLQVALGAGDGTFATPTISNLLGGDAIRSSSLASADFDGDGNIDLALFDTNDYSGVFYGKGDGTFTSVPFNGSVIPKDLLTIAAFGNATALDLNKDGKPDIVAGATVLLNSYGTVTQPTKFATTTALTTSATSLTAGSSLTLTATISGATGSTAIPSGTVTFLDGTTPLGTGTLASGVAPFATSTLAVGTHSITATYGGDANFTGSTSSASTVTVSAAVAPDFTVTINPASGTETKTSPATATLSVTPANGFNAAVSFACTGQPATITCGFSPATVTPSGATAATTTVTFAATTTATNRSPFSHHLPETSFAVALGVWLLMRRRLNRASIGQWTVFVAVALLTLAGCGGSKHKVAATTSTVTITATSGAISHTASYSLTSTN